MEFTEIYRSINFLPFIDSEKFYNIIKNIQKQLLENRVDVETVIEIGESIRKKIKQHNISDKAVDVIKSRQLLIEIIKKEVAKLI